MWTCQQNERLLLPNGKLIVNVDLHAELVSRGISVQVEPVWVAKLIDLPVASWIAHGEPVYPSSGEPEAYFSEFQNIVGFIAGFSSIYQVVVPDTVVVIDRDAAFDPKVPQPIPRIVTPPPERLSNSFWQADSSFHSWPILLF